MDVAKVYNGLVMKKLSQEEAITRGATRDVARHHVAYGPPQNLNSQPSTLNPQPLTRNPQPSTLNPQPSTLNPTPYKPKVNPRAFFATVGLEHFPHLLDAISGGATRDVARHHFDPKIIDGLREGRDSNKWTCSMAR